MHERTILHTVRARLSARNRPSLAPTGSPGWSPTGCATYQALAGLHGSPQVPQESTVTEQRLTAGPGQTVQRSTTVLCCTKVWQRTKMSPNFVILTSFLSITSLIWRPRCERRNFMAVSSIFFSGFFHFLTPKKVASWSQIVIWS